MQIYFDVRRTAWLNPNTFPACEVILQNSSYSAMHSICNCVIISLGDCMNATLIDSYIFFGLGIGVAVQFSAQPNFSGRSFLQKPSGGSQAALHVGPGSASSVTPFLLQSQLKSVKVARNAHNNHLQRQTSHNGQRRTAGSPVCVYVSNGLRSPSRPQNTGRWFCQLCGSFVCFIYASLK